MKGSEKSILTVNTYRFRIPDVLSTCHGQHPSKYSSNVIA